MGNYLPPVMLVITPTLASPMSLLPGDTNGFTLLFAYRIKRLLGQNYVYHKDYDLRLIDEFRLYLDTVLILIYVLLLQLVIRI